MATKLGTLDAVTALDRTDLLAPAVAACVVWLPGMPQATVEVEPSTE